MQWDLTYNKHNHNSSHTSKKQAPVSGSPTHFLAWRIAAVTLPPAPASWGCGKPPRTEDYYTGIPLPWGWREAPRARESPISPGPRGFPAPPGQGGINPAMILWPTSPSTRHHGSCNPQGPGVLRQGWCTPVIGSPVC